MTPEFGNIMALLVWAKENGVHSIGYGDFYATFETPNPELSGNDLKEVLDKSSTITPEQYDEILYHSARS